MSEQAQAITTTCPHCGAGLIVPVHFGGEWHACPGCRNELYIPRLGERPQPATD